MVRVERSTWNAYTIIYLSMNTLDFEDVKEVGSISMLTYFDGEVWHDEIEWLTVGEDLYIRDQGEERIESDEE